MKQYANGASTNSLDKNMALAVIPLHLGANLEKTQINTNSIPNVENAPWTSPRI